jgi:hypothetical protein
MTAAVLGLSHIVMKRSVAELDIFPAALRPDWRIGRRAADRTRHDLSCVCVRDSCNWIAAI